MLERHRADAESGRATSENVNVNADVSEGSPIELARSIAFLLDAGARETGEPDPVRSTGAPPPERAKPLPPVDWTLPDPAAEPEPSPWPDGVPEPKPAPAGLYVERMTPRDPTLRAAAATSAKIKNGRWTVLDLQGRPYDEAMGEASQDAAERKAAAILAARTPKPEPEKD